MHSFLTGSRVYGLATDDSDIDLVVYTDNKTKQALIEESDSGSMPVRYGNLNLILVTTPEEWDSWFKAKVRCEENAPVGRRTAVRTHINCGVSAASAYGTRFQRAVQRLLGSRLPRRRRNASR